MIVFLSLCLLLGLVLYWQTRKPAGFPPGPMGLPILGYIPFVGKKPYETFNELANKYGDVIGFNWGPFQRLVFLNSYSAIRDAFKEDVLSGRPDTYLFTLRSDGKHGVTFNQGSDWQEVRRHSLRILRDFGFGKSYLETAIASETTELLDVLRNDVGVPMRPDGRFNLSVLNALWAITTGERIRLDDPLMNRVLHRLRRQIGQTSSVGVAQLIPYSKYVPPWLIGAHSVVQQFATIRKLFQEEIERQLEVYKKNGQADNFIKTFLAKVSNAEPGSAFHGQKGMKNLVYVVMDLFVAGSETISTTLTWMIYFMINNPQVQERVHQELDRVVGRSRMPGLEDRPLLPYTEAVLMETHRCASIIPLGVAHSALADTEFRGYKIPKGTLLLTNIYAVHHDPQVWEKPNDFHPEHFLDEQGQVKQVDQLIPFLIGKRSCLGESLARMELYLFATHLLNTFKFSAVEGKPIPQPEAKPTALRNPPLYEVVLSLR